AAQLQAEGSPGRRAQAAGLVAEGGAEFRQITAQVRKRLRGGALRPEDAGEPFPLHLPASAKRQQRQQPVDLSIAWRRKRLAMEPHLQGTEEPQFQRPRARSLRW